MTWSTSEIEYDNFPLLLRKPDYADIWEFKNKFTQLVRIEHLLENTKKDGLPEKSYNKLLADFDHHMCTSLLSFDKGIIFLIETFAGKRNYYYYSLPNLIITNKVNKTSINYKVTLETNYQNDLDWGFLKEYPVELYSL